MQKLKEELGKLPSDYDPFPDLVQNAKIGAMFFANSICLSPMVGKNEIYDGDIKHPDASLNGISEWKDRDEEVIVGAKFEYQRRQFVLYRTDGKHRNP